MVTRRIYLKNAFNVRDLGGYRTESGHTTKWRTLIRSDSVSALDAADWKQLFDNNIRTVVDLRSSAEAEAMPDRVMQGMRYVFCPLQEEEIDLTNPQLSAVSAFSKSLTQGYCHLVNHCPDLLKAALLAVLEALADGAVLFHCSAGKDRTGVLAAALLYLLGVGKEDIIADYQVSCTYNSRGINKFLGSAPQYEGLRHLRLSEPASMETLLALFETLDLKTALGLSKQELDRLHELCTA